MKLLKIALLSAAFAFVGTGCKKKEKKADPAAATKADPAAKTDDPSAKPTATPTKPTETPKAEGGEADVDWAKAEGLLKSFAGLFKGKDTDCAAAAAGIDKLATDNAEFMKKMGKVKSPKSQEMGKKYMGTPAVAMGMQKCMADKAFGAAMMKMSGK